MATAFTLSTSDCSVILKKKKKKECCSPRAFVRTCRFRWREALSSTLYLLLLGEKHCVTELGAVAVLPAGCESWLPNSHLCDLGLVVHLSAPPRPHRYRFPHDPKVECVPLKPFVSQSGVKQRHRCSQTEVKAVLGCRVVPGAGAQWGHSRCLGCTLPLSWLAATHQRLFSLFTFHRKSENWSWRPR